MDDAIRRAIVRYFDNDIDFDERHEMYAEDAVLEFPSRANGSWASRVHDLAEAVSGERDVPDPAYHGQRRPVGHRDPGVLQRLRADVRVDILRFRDGKVVRESIYVMEAFGAAAGRAEWSTPFDPLASVAPQDWREGAAFGLEIEAAPVA